MTLFRVLQVVLAAFLLYGSVWFFRPSEEAPVRGRTALADAMLQNNNNNNNNNANDNNANNNNNANDNNVNDNDLNNNNNANDNGDNNNNNNNNGNDNEDDNNNNGNDNDDCDDNDNDDCDDGFDDNDNFDVFVPPPRQNPAAEQPACSTPGREDAFVSFDRKVQIRVFPTMPVSVRFQILQVIDFLSAPLPPGNIVGLLVYEIRAAECTGPTLQTLPAEVNLAIRYNDVEATGLDEARFTIALLDLGTRVWNPVEKQANDPGNNVVTATISQTRFYAVYESR